MKEKQHPILEHPGFGQAVIEPARIFRKKARLPRRCVLCFFLDELKRDKRRGNLKLILKLGGEGEPISVYKHGRGKKALAVCFPGVGAPMAAAVLEELIGLGCDKFICCGGAGVLDSSIPAGEVMIPSSAMRDEGTSYHYQVRGRFSRPHPEAVSALREACEEMRLSHLAVKSWTTDAVYRETPAKVKLRKRQGCKSVEMEASALFAVAKFRSVIFGQVLYAGDDIGGKKWKHRSWTELSATRKRLYEIARRACLKL